jgi:outer membrane protein OmpA-like peptidoglycan-associated protein
MRNARLLELARINVESHEQTLEKISRRSRSGAGRRSQLEQTEGRTSRARASYIAQQNNFQDALTQAHQVLGRYVDLTTLVEPGLPSLPGSDLDDLIDFALDNHPALKVASMNIQAASANYKQAKSRRLPSVDLRLAQEYGNDINGIPGRTDQASITLNLNYNLYNGGADRAERRKRISVVSEQQQFAARVRRQVINTLRLAWMADQSLVEQLVHLERYVEQAKKTSESYQEEFFVGERDLIDLLDAKSELNSAQNRYAEARFDALAARFRILEATGQLFDAVGLNPEMEDDALVISKVDTQGLDTLPLNTDFDEDEETDRSDHCDNSLPGSSVNVYGCVQVASAMEQAASSVGDNTAPEAGDDEFYIKDGRVLIITQAFLLQNDQDADRDVLEIEGFTQPANGMLAYDDQRNLVYRPNEGFLGRDSFSYTLSDGRDADSGNVFVEVQPEYTLDISAVHMINYKFDRSALTDASINKFNQVAALLINNPSLRLKISAYTDSTGSEEYNQNLSWRRAKATMAELMAKGVSKEQIQTFGGGESNPIADNATKEGQAINRRGEFEFISP